MLETRLIPNEPRTRARRAPAEVTCRSCPYGFLGRCAGDEARRTDVHQAVGCQDLARMTTYFDNVSRRLCRVVRPVKTPDLPALIPEAIRLKSTFQLPERPLYAVSLSTLLTANGNVRFDGDPSRLRRSLRLSEEAKLMLLGTGDDPRLEAFWKSAERSGGWDKLRSFGFDVATTFTFSVWGDDPRFDQIYNQDRNLATFEIFSSWGLPTIPFLFQAVEEDTETALEWLRGRPEVDVLAILTQLHRDETRFQELLEQAHGFLERVNRPLRVLIVGTCCPWKLRVVRSKLTECQLHFVTSQPIYRAMMGKRADHHLRFTDARPTPCEHLVAPNLASFDAAVS